MISTSIIKAKTQADPPWSLSPMDKAKGRKWSSTMTQFWKRWKPTMIWAGAVPASSSFQRLIEPYRSTYKSRIPNWPTPAPWTLSGWSSMRYCARWCFTPAKANLSLISSFLKSLYRSSSQSMISCDLNVLSFSNQGLWMFCWFWDLHTAGSSKRLTILKLLYLQITKMLAGTNLWFLRFLLT